METFIGLTMRDFIVSTVKSIRYQLFLIFNFSLSFNLIPIEIFLGLNGFLLLLEQVDMISH